MKNRFIYIVVAAGLAGMSQSAKAEDALAPKPAEVVDAVVKVEVESADVNDAADIEVVADVSDVPAEIAPADETIKPTQFRGPRRGGDDRDGERRDGDGPRRGMNRGGDDRPDVRGPQRPERGRPGMGERRGGDDRSEHARGENSRRGEGRPGFGQRDRDGDRPDSSRFGNRRGPGFGTGSPFRGQRFGAERNSDERPQIRRGPAAGGHGGSPVAAVIQKIQNLEKEVNRLKAEVRQLKAKGNDNRKSRNAGEAKRGGRDSKKGDQLRGNRSHRDHDRGGKQEHGKRK